MSVAPAPPWVLKRYDLRFFVTVAVVALVYFGAAKFGLLFAFSHPQVSAVWPSTGIAVAALMLFGHRIWPAILIGAFVANVTHDESALTAAGIAVGNTLAALVAVWTLLRIGFDPTLARVRDALMLMAVSTVTMTISATNGVANLALAGLVPWHDYFEVWRVWWMGDGIGVFVVVPLILSWATNGRVELSSWRLVELVLLSATMVVLALIVLNDAIIDHPHATGYKYLLFLGVIWAAMRFEQRGTSALVVLLVGVALWGTTQGRGPFVEGNLDRRLIDLELFASTLAVTGLVLATVTVERERARTCLQQANDELAAAESRLRTVIAKAPLVIWSTDTRGRCTFVDGAVLAKLSMAPRQLIGLHYSDIVPDENFDRAMKAVLKGDAGQMVGKFAGLMFQTHTESLRNERNEIVGAIGVSIDVTERMRAEMEQQRLAERMLHAQKLESLGVLAGGIAHDFNNLLTAIVGNADLALMCRSSEAAMREHIGQIEIAAYRAADLTRQMLAYAGKGPFKVVPLDLSKAAEEMAQLLSASVSKKANLSYHFMSDLPLIEADPAQISQVVMNLITNASDALEGSGSITVSTGVMEADAQTLAGCIFDDGINPGRFVYVEVSDTGSGMDASIASRMFDPFFTTKFAGRGLGLSAVRGIMRGHKGTLRVISQPGHGTTVRALFPVGATAAEPKRALPDADTSWRGQGTILVVDDEQSVREVSGVMLEAFGFSVIAAADGERAVAAYRQSPESIRAVLLDMTMPVLNGEETFAALKRVNPDVKVVLCSGYTEQDAVARFAGLGLAGFLQKPFVAADLITLMRRVLEN